MTHKELALDYFDRKFHCSQAVLAAFKDDMPEGTVLADKLRKNLTARTVPIDIYT